MAKMVKAWNKRTGEALPNRVPQSWIDGGVFPNLVASQAAATRAADAPAASGGKSTTKTKEA